MLRQVDLFHDLKVREERIGKVVEGRLYLATSCQPNEREEERGS